MICVLSERAEFSKVLYLSSCDVMFMNIVLVSSQCFLIGGFGAVVKTRPSFVVCYSATPGPVRFLLLLLQLPPPQTRAWGTSARLIFNAPACFLFLRPLSNIFSEYLSERRLGREDGSEPQCYTSAANKFTH